MIVTRNRHQIDNYDNRALKLCINLKERNTITDELLKQLINTLQFDHCFTGGYTISKKSLFRAEKWKNIKSCNNLTNIIDLYQESVNGMSISLVEHEANEASIELSKKLYTESARSEHIICYQTPRQREIEQISIPVNHPDVTKQMILERNKNHFDDHTYFNGLRPMAVTIAITSDQWYLAIDKGILSDDTTNKLANEWKEVLVKFAKLEMSEGAYCGLDTAIMNQTAHEEYFDCSKQKDRFSGYLWCNLLTANQFKQIGAPSNSELIKTMPIGNNIMIYLNKSLTTSNYSDYKALKTLLLPILSKGKSDVSVEEELTERSSVVIFSNEITISNNAVYRQF